MSILINGMAMPKNCGECPIICDYDLAREARGTEKAENCPLVELPPHGRLIDADALTEVFSECHDDWVKHQVEIAPTIIEAEGE